MINFLKYQIKNLWKKFTNSIKIKISEKKKMDINNQSINSNNIMWWKRLRLGSISKNSAPAVCGKPISKV